MIVKVKPCIDGKRKEFWSQKKLIDVLGKGKH